VGVRGVCERKAEVEKSADGEVPVPEIVLLYCRQCVRDDAVRDLGTRNTAGYVLRPTMLACSSKVQAPHLLRILERGADGVEVVACPRHKCRFLAGSARAARRVAYVQALLEQIHMGAGRVGLSFGAGLGVKELSALAKARADAVRPLGPNPMGNERRFP